MAQLEFFNDCSSPWTYLAFHKIEEIAAASDAELLWRPILVGGVFNAVNQNVYSERANPSNERRARYMARISPTGRAPTVSRSASRSSFPISRRSD